MTNNHIISAFSDHITVSGLSDTDIVTIRECKDALLHVVRQVTDKPAGYISASALFCLSMGQHDVITGKPEKNADSERYWDVIPVYIIPPTGAPVYQCKIGVLDTDSDKTDWFWSDCDRKVFDQYEPALRRILYSGVAHDTEC